MPPSVRSFVFETGTIANAHYVAIPFNSASRSAALVTANFLLSPEAQAHKLHPAIWGDPTVLSLDRLPPVERARFEAIPNGVATLPSSELGPSLAEPHTDWMTRLEAAWMARYSH